MVRVTHHSSSIIAIIYSFSLEINATYTLDPPQLIDLATELRKLMNICHQKFLYVQNI